MTNPAGTPWPGEWVSRSLGIGLVDAPNSRLSLSDLLGLALRRNPRRAHLLVSRVLGKHIPTDPRVVYGAGRLLGVLAGEALGARVDDAEFGIGLLRAALDAPGGPLAGGRANELIRWCDRQIHDADGTVVIGYAETATGLGHAVADSLGADYLHSTRREGTGVPASGGFEEEHSHATTHRLLPSTPGMLSRPAPVVLVDDELSTGQTVINTIVALQDRQPRDRYVIACLVDLRSPADHSRIQQVAANLDVTIETVSLGQGHLNAPADVIERGQRILATHEGRPAVQTAATSALVNRFDLPFWPAGVPDGGRHGFAHRHREGLERVTRKLAGDLAGRLIDRLDRREPARVLVLGTEEFMHVPVRIAGHLADALAPVRPAIEVLFSSTTRSPVLALDEPGYALRTGMQFPAHDGSIDGAQLRFAYNVRSSEPASRFDVIVLVLEAGTGPAAEPLIAQLAQVTNEVWVIGLPMGGRPLSGPEFGSYPAADVTWLLSNLSNLDLEAPTEEREEAIQNGGAHYAESLPVEFQPSAEYQELFLDALSASSRRIAAAIGVVTEIILAERGQDVVLASLARAGTPIGVLIRRWAEFAHNLNLRHYAVSIVRGRGIDTAALDYLRANHDPRSVVFVDGWTGKGAITRELTAAIGAYNEAWLGPHNGADRAGLGFVADLAVLADPAGCAQIFGTRDDFLIPSACLNSTVSGLVSRTVLNDAYIGPGQFHGAKFYADLAASDVSNVFIDAIVAQFPSVASAVSRDWPSRQSSDRRPTWVGLKTVQEISAHYRIDDVNLVKPGVGETTRVLLRRVPWKILIRTDAQDELQHVRLLAAQRGAEVEFVDDLAFACVGLIHPAYTRGAIGADGKAATG
ncbi:MAG: hypothetical protein JWM76_979 [Pseudonocardiales bacterium]|nr:hypothetical protein [Pseudonocardiales bacterium]